jgi:signal transduction histidine kinase
MASRTPANKIGSRPLLTTIGIAVVVSLVVVLIVYIRFGKGIGFPAAPVIVPLAHGFFAVAALAICFLAFGRYRVLRDPISFWIGTAFASTTVVMTVYVLSFPINLPRNGQFISLLPGPPAWILAFSQLTFSMLYLPAGLTRQPLKLRQLGRAWILYVAVIVYVSALCCAVLVLAGKRLPVLVGAGGTFKPAIYSLGSLPLLLMGTAALIALRGYRRSGEPLYGYTALSQIMFLFAYAVFYFSVQRYDLWWCGSRIFAAGACTAMLTGLLSGYLTLYRSELNHAHTLQRMVDELSTSEKELRTRAHELAIANEELESFSFSVSHDLRTQLHILTAFAYLLKEELGDKLGEAGNDYLFRIANSVDFMNTVIECILKLSRISRHDLSLSRVNMSSLAAELIDELRHEEPERTVEAVIQDGLSVSADKSLMTVALSNLIRNAWKFSGKNPNARIEIGCERKEERLVYFVRDNGAGFDMLHAEKIFKPFKRLHPDGDFPGSGIGLALVSRAIKRHGGTIWAVAQVNEGACFYFTLPGSPVEEHPDLFATPYVP